MASTPVTRRSSRINASLNAVKVAVSPKIKSSVNNVKVAVSPKIKSSVNTVKAAVSPKIKESVDRVKAAVSPSNIIDSCRRVSRRVAASKIQSNLADSNNNNDKSSRTSDKKSEPTPKLGPDEVKEQLGTCGRLDILRSRLVKINKCGTKVRNFKKDVEHLDSCEPTKSTPKSSKRVEKIDKGNVPVENDPGYEKYLHLAAKPEEGLVLPAKLKVLNDYFRSVDTVISLLHNRQETATFNKLESAVQEIMKKKFSRDILSKIKTVFPEAYSYRQDRTKTPTGSIEYNLVITPNFQYKSSESTYSKMTSSDLTERRYMFSNSLILIIKTHHDKFLESLDEPVLIKDSLKRWHPEFDLSEIPDIELAPLPQPPEAEKLDNAVDVLSKAMDIFNLGPNESKPIPDEQKPDIVAPSPKVDAALKGVSASLLEKIRAREAARASQCALLKSKAQTKELDMLSRLPEVARILRNTFITERKVALPWETIINKISATYSSTIYDRDVDDHLHRLVKETPSWLSICKVSSGTYLKINKTIDVNDIITLLQNLLKSKQ